jgi:WD40 repeat protein
MRIKNIITHPGEVIIIRASPANKKILASKNDINEVYLWTSDKYKLNTNASYANVPDIILNTFKSDKPNYAIKFAPSLMRLISASGSRI